MRNFDDFLRDELDKPVTLRKEGQVVGHISPMEAAAKSLVAKASQGDLSAISFIRQMTRTTNPDQETKAKAEYDLQIAEVSEKIKSQLEKDKLYDGQDLEIRSVSEIAVTLNKLSEIMSHPDFQLVATDIKTGHQTISPVIQLRDKQRDLFQQQIQKLRDDALRRILTIKQMEL